MTAPAFDCLFSVEDRRKRREMRGYPRTRTQAATLTTLASLPDDTLLQVIAACGKTDGVPLFEAVKGLSCLTKAVRQQFYRLRPLVGVRSLAVVQRASQRRACGVKHGPWRVTLLYHGKLTEAVLEQARQGLVRSIYMFSTYTERWNTIWGSTEQALERRVVSRVVPELLSADCSLLELKLDHVRLDGTWASIFGEAAVCSTALRSLWLTGCVLRGPLPELRLPALQHLNLNSNHLSGSLEPLRSCTALREVQLMSNRLTGGLEPLRGCTALRELDLYLNLLTGSLEPLRGCKALQLLDLSHNRQLTAPLLGCTALRKLDFEDTQLVLSNEDKAHFEKQCGWDETEE